MTKIVVVTSGKGGVGKTTTSASFASGLALRGHKTVVIDFDVGLRNLDLVMGAERRVVYDLVNVIQGDAKLTQALIRDKRLDTLFLLPASQTRDKDALTEEGVGRVGHGLPARRLTHKGLAAVLDGDDGGRGAIALGVLDDLGGLAVHDGDARVRGAQVDADDSSHVLLHLCPDRACGSAVRD